MSIRDWSFSRLWAVTACFWLIAFGAGEVLDYFDLGGLAAFALAVAPAFLAGAWAGTHPEIASWPRARLAAMWGLAIGTLLGATEYVDHWRAVALVIAAPVSILSLRWYELTEGARRFRDLPPSTLSSPIITPPPAEPPKRLPAN